MNKTILIGNLTRDPELTATPSGVSVCKMSIAVNRNFTNANGERETDFFNIVAWSEAFKTAAMKPRTGRNTLPRLWQTKSNFCRP